MKLGKLSPKRSLKTPALGNYLTPSKLPVPPSKNAWEYAVTTSWHMLANDKIGDCTCAAAAHMEMNWSANSGTLYTPTEADTVQAYSAITGYVPGDESTDKGAVELDVLKYWKSTGIANRKILGYATLDVQNIDQIKAAIYLFGGVYIGFSVPAYIMEDTGNHHWRVQNTDTQSVGGHAVPFFGYGRAGATCVSWGSLYTMSWDFFQAQVDEAYAIVSADWIKSSGLSPVGIDLNGLLADLSEV